jgi:hypothetical protein
VSVEVAYSEFQNEAVFMTNIIRFMLLIIETSVYLFWRTFAGYLRKLEESWRNGYYPTVIGAFSAKSGCTRKKSSAFLFPPILIHERFTICLYQHLLELFRRPLVHRDRSHETAITSFVTAWMIPNVHTQAPVNSRAFKAEKDPESDGCPLRIRRTAIDTGL